jgi:hypothetical protein
LLAIRLETSVAHWRDADAVRRAVIGWIEASLANTDAEDREVFVAHVGGDVVAGPRIGGDRAYGAVVPTSL